MYRVNFRLVEMTNQTVFPVKQTSSISNQYKRFKSFASSQMNSDQQASTYCVCVPRILKNEDAVELSLSINLKISF